MEAVLEERVSGLVNESSGIIQGDSQTNRTTSSYELKLFVERYLERPVYRGDPQMLTLPTACTIKSIPVLDDF